MKRTKSKISDKKKIKTTKIRGKKSRDKQTGCCRIQNDFLVTSLAVDPNIDHEFLSRYFEIKIQ